MRDRHKSETSLAWITLAVTGTHFILETWYHLTWGQPLQALIVDYICVALMATGAVGSLRINPSSAAGLLAAGWAFALGFAWRSVFGRIELLETGQQTANGEAASVLPLLIGSLILVTLGLVWALVLAWRQSRSPLNPAKSVTVE